MAKRGVKGRATAGRASQRKAPGGSKRDRLALHEARCGICKHPDREEIDREFLHWVSPRELAEQWKVASYRAIYRHVHMTGLYEQRRKNRLAALDRIIERVGEVSVTAAAVVAAIRLSARLEREEKEPQNTGGHPAGFRFTLDGLPRTDAVTGHTAVVTSRRGDPLGRPAAAKAVSGAPSSATPQKQQTKNIDSPSGHENGAAAAGKKGAQPGRQKAASQGASAPQVTQPAPAEPDPRIVLAEDGRVAGIPWPKGKITFARRGRWGPRPG